MRGYSPRDPPRRGLRALERSATPPAGSVAIDRLEKKKLVKRRATSDRRVRLVELTDKGRKLGAKTFSRHAAAMEKVTTLSRDERLKLLELLKKLGKGAEQVSLLS